MKCVFCDVDPHDRAEVLCLVPAENSEDWSCLPCAKKQGLYCERHDQIHTRFEGHLGEASTHACIPCIEEMVRSSAALASEYETRIRRVLTEVELIDLDEWIATARSVTGDADDARTLLRAIATMAARTSTAIEVVVADVEARRTVKHLLLSYYFL